MSLLRMLRQFHYIDSNGKDQGINVRNRSQELVKLLGDVDAIRAERKKARANRNKFGGMEGGMAGGFSGQGSGRYGGFGSDSFGG
jgi:epsin